ncbi:MAG: exopolysaccharide biosynthesis protein EpsL [Massilia sp.]|jgi:exopolysaccharide biosynthesis operon protein EpsL|nr:exopolysaccharide biosynthesis protein EpsL [Massilia sp.]MDB5953190.1 exopolysaccharide biosynthesis protein EpsL [Massilia sp.]
MKKMLISLPNPNSFSSPRSASRLCLLFAALCGAPASAAPSDALHVYAGLGYGHDDNLLRVPEGFPAFDNQLGDSWYQADAGLLFDHTYSRQRISGHAKLSKVKFSHFQQLDYDGHDLEGTWNWQVGNHFAGKLGATYNQSLASYTDLRSDQRNLRRQRSAFFDGGWRLHPSYRLRAGASKDKYSYDLADQRANDRTEDAWEAGADYLPASGSEIGLVLRKVKGKYPNRRPLGQLLVNDDYDQDEFKARVFWIAGGSTTVQALGGWVKRRQRSLGDDTSGFNGRISAAYKRSGALSYNAALWRDFAPIESTVLNYTLNKGVSVGAAWDLSAKAKLDASAVYERRAYNARLLAIRGDDLKDSIRSANLRATWKPRQSVQVSATLARQSRSGSAFLGSGSFTSNSITVNVNATF